MGRQGTFDRCFLGCDLRNRLREPYRDFCFFRRFVGSKVCRGGSVRLGEFQRRLQTQQPGDDLLGDKAQHAEGEHEKQYEGAEPARL